MPLIENRIVPSNREEYLEKLAESLKALQEESRFTDVILYSGDGGAGIPIHKTVLKKLSSPLSGMLEDSSCCFCLGTRCLKGSETFGITLQGTKTEDIKALVALIYTGKTPISGPDHYRAIREVAELLQIRLPKSSITLEKDDGSGVEYMEEEEDEDERESVCSRKRKAEIDDDEDAYDSRKIMNRVGSSEEEEEDPYLATKNCPKCNEAFTNQIEYVRHVNACSLREAEKTINTNPPRPRHPCPGCGVLYPDSPWFRQHVKICTSNNKANGGGSGEDVIGLDDNDNYQTCPKCDTLISTNDVGTHVCRATTLLNKLNSISIESTSDNPEGKKLCPKCHRWFFVMKGGYVRHVRACLPMPTTPQVSDSISTVNGIMAEDGKSKACPKCGKVYTPKNYRYFDPHVARCMGPAEPTAVIEPPPPQSGPIQTCKGCNKSFTLNHWYQKHVATCRKRNLDLLQRPGLTITETGSYGCHKCSHTYATRGDLKRHLIQHYGERVRQLFNTSLSDKCSLCPFVAQTSDQMVVHLCLKHEKLRDVIPKDVSRMLYQEIGNNTALNLQQPRQTSPPQQQQQQLQLGVHSMMVQQLPTGTSADIVNNCHVCGKVFNNRTSLRSHIFTHYLNDLRKVYHDPRDPTACIICTYRSSSIHHLMIHVGLKHKKLAEFLPREISAYFFDDNARAFARRPVPTLQPHHQILQQRLQQNNSGPPPPPLKMITMQSKPFIGSRFGHTSTKNWTCMFCYKELGNDKGNLKQHLLCHTRDKIRDHFMNPNNPRSCLFCDYNSNLPDHMITHVGLTHQKIREFLPRDYGDILFRGPYAFELQPSNVAFCEHCTMEFTSVEELEKHLKRNGGNCVWNCPKCGLKTQGRKNVEKHTMHCQRKPSIFNCEVCGLECHDLTTFKSHLCSHFKQELMNVIGSDVSRCDDCGIDFGTDSTGLATHVGTTHDVIFNVIPANLLKKVKSLMMETIYCFICQKEFSTPSDLAGHECIPVEDSDDQADDEFCRLCGEMTITSYQQYKEHLYSHFMNKLNTDFRSDYDKDKKACERCEEPVDDCISYIKHLALDHDEILKYIDEDTMNHLKNVLHKSNHMNSSIGDPMEHASFEMDFSIKDESMSPGYDTEDHDGIICDYSSRDSSGIANNYSNANNDDVFIDVPEEDELDDVEEDHIKNNSSPININNGEIHSHPSPEKIMGETNSFVDSNSFEKSTGSSNLISSNLHET